MSPGRRGFRLLVAAGLALCFAGVLLTIPTGLSQSPPTVDSATVDGSTLTITLSESVDVMSTANASDFTVTRDGTAVSVNGAEVSGSTITLMLAEAAGDPDCESNASTFAVSYTRSGSSITASGSELDNFSGQSVTNGTDHPPAIESIETDVDGRYIYVTFCELITTGEYGYLTINAFSASINGDSELISDVQIRSDASSGLAIKFGRNYTINEGDVVNVAYDRSEATDGDPPQDKDQGEKQVESWSARPVTNKVDSPPSLVSVTAEWDEITLTYSEELDEYSVPDKSAFTIGGGPYQLDVESVGVSGKTVTLTVSDVVRADLQSQFQLSYSPPQESPLQQVDGAKQAPSFSSQLVMSSTPKSKPEVTDAEVDGTVLKITFDLPLKSVAPASAFTIATPSGVSVAASSFKDSVVTLTLSPAVSAGSEVTVSYKDPAGPPRIEARNNKDADSFSNRSVTNKTVAPLPEFRSAVVSVDGAALTITFSLALDESSDKLPASSAFSLSGTDASVESVGIDGSTVSLALDPPVDVDETITLGYTAPSDEMAGRLQSAADAQAVATFSGQAVTNNADGKPRPISAEVDGSSLTVSFNRSLDAASLPAASAFALAGATATVADRSIDGAQLTLTLSPAVNHTETLTVSYAAPAESPLKRDGKEILVESFAALSVTNVTPDPTPTFNSASVDPTGQTLTIVMTHPLLSTTAGIPATSAFTLTGSAQAEITSVSIDDVSIELGLSPAADVNETLTISYQPPTDATEPALQSTVGMWKTAAWSDQPVTNHTDGKPRPAKATANGESLVLTFDRALDSDVVPLVGDFTMTPEGIGVAGVSIDGASLMLNLSPAVEFDDIVSVSYTPGDSKKLKRVKDGQDFEVEEFTDFPAENETPEPLVRTVVGDRTSIVVTFSTVLDGNSVPDGAAFSLDSDGPPITEVSISGMTLNLTLGSDLTEGAAYTLTYTSPMTSPLQRSDGSAIPDLEEEVTNDTDFPPTVESVVGNEDTVTITFDQALDSMANISVSSFSLTGDSERTVTAVAVDGATLTLTLSSALKEEESASLTYTKPDQGGIVDQTENQAESFTKAIDNQTDTAPVPVSGTVEDDTIVIVLDQELAARSLFDLDLDDDSVVLDHFFLSGVDTEEIDVVRVAVSNDGPDGVGKIVITLSKNVKEEDSIMILYHPGGDGKVIRDFDSGMKRVEIDNYPLENLTVSPPAFTGATVDGDVLTVMFDRALDPDVEPEVDWFVLEPVADEDDQSSPLGSTLAAEVLSASITGQSVRLLVSLLVPEEVKYKLFFLEIAPSVPEDVEYELTYTPPATGGLVGETGKAVTKLDDAVAVENVTDYAPRPLFALAEATGKVEGASRVVLQFDQPIDKSGSIDSDWFTFEPTLTIRPFTNGAERSEDDQLLIELDASQWIREGVNYLLRYDSGDSDGLQDPTGNEIMGFPISVQNDVDVAPLLESVTVNRRLVTLEFDQDLDADFVPPPNCESLESEIEDFDCSFAGDPTWFTVQKNGTGSELIDSVAIDGRLVILTLSVSADASDRVTVKYGSVSLDIENRWNLRDVQMDPQSEPNQVGTIDPTEATNITAVAAISTSFDRAQPKMITVEFDGALPAGSNLSTGPIFVAVDGTRTVIQQLSTSGSTLGILLEQAVPECVSLKLSYSPSDGAWLDAAGHPIEAFEFEIGNFIDRSRQLTCVRSDAGALVLTFSEETSDMPEIEVDWSLTVNGEARAFNVEVLDEVVQLVPVEAVCVGDLVAITQSRSDLATDLSLSRMIDRAAPCAVSAVAVGTDLTVTFDQPLDAVLPGPGEFAIDEVAAVQSAVAVEGQVLSLRLAPPGVSAHDGASLSYTGSSLRGGGLTVAPFVVPISDRTEPPVFESGFGIGSLIVLNFDQGLLPREVAAARFIPTGPGLDVKIDRVEINGSSVYLHLEANLPDEPDLFGVGYLAHDSGGLAGLTGSRVGNSVFLVRNYTETPPTVLLAVVDSLDVDVTFDQPVVANGALPSDFTVTAGHRTIAVTSIEWSETGVGLTLSERVTSLDAVIVRYVPGDGRGVEDRSGLALEPFEFLAENRTPAPDSIAGRIADARIRSNAEGTTFARELARSFASDDGLSVEFEGGTGRTTIVRGGMRVTVDAGRIEGELSRIGVAPVEHISAMLEQLDMVPSSCWNADDSAQVSAWSIGANDRHGTPTDRRVRVTLSGAFDPFHSSTVCVMNLITGEWSFHDLGQPVVGPALVMIRETPARPIWESMPLVG